MNTVILRPTRCAICHSEANSTELYPATFNQTSFNSTTFSARRVPDGVHYRVVKCNRCGLVRSDPVADSDTLADLYSRSSFDYLQEVDNIRNTYGHYLAKAKLYNKRKGGLLEIGCGNGFFLEVAISQGYHPVQGIEASYRAVEKAASSIRKHIVCDIMEPGTFDPGQFEMICMFQVLDHLSEPWVIIKECYKLLKPGGLILIITHNVESLSAKILKNRSPIIDIEHTYLFSPTTLAGLLKLYGFSITKSGPARNIYSIRYLTQMAPMPNGIKRAVLYLMRLTSIGCFRLSLPLGNLYMIAQKPF